MSKYYIQMLKARNDVMENSIRKAIKYLDKDANNHSATERLKSAFSAKQVLEEALNEIKTTIKVKS